MEFQRSDAMLMEILQGRKTIVGFLDSIFGFLRRNTDFYHTKKDEADRIGFPKGMRDQILYGAMQRYDPDCILQSMNVESEIGGNGTFLPPAVEEVIVESEAKIPQHKADSAEAVFSPIDYKNGAVFASHCWSQTLKDVEVQVKLPEELKISKNLNIDIKATKLKVSSKQKPEHVILEGNLSQRIRHNEALWTIDHNMLHISCDKARELWWDRLFEGDAEIDTKKIDCERYIDDLPDDTQATIEKLRVQQMEADKQQSQLQASNPEQHKTMERLRAAWDADGSPFKGQQFDPSIVRMS
ncbi:GL21703 [Drosophila persimilis]|uniref:Nuclear migration protein nudC n=1 Tax=Drosophila persimilis TaxID=7234 RepID=B4GF19_DROPE|nr:nudC domain-containing protein 3 [Drosophila persimilis]EDW34204.1 GL21703 [Drosophila persimilis]